MIPYTATANIQDLLAESMSLKRPHEVEDFTTYEDDG
jgi:hypothetical protein